MHVAAAVGLWIVTNALLRKAFISIHNYPLAPLQKLDKNSRPFKFILRHKHVPFTSNWTAVTFILKNMLAFYLIVLCKATTYHWTQFAATVHKNEMKHH